MCDRLARRHAQHRVAHRAREQGRKHIDGKTALAWGIANRAVPADQVDATARQLADKLAQRAPNSIRKTKGLMRDAEALWGLMQREAEAFGSQMRSPEAMEAFLAFSQKRAPDFSKAG